MNKKNKMSFNSFVFKKSDLNKIIGFDYFENEKNYKNIYHYHFLNEWLINNCGFWLNVKLTKLTLKKWISWMIVFYHFNNFEILKVLIKNFKNDKDLVNFQKKIVLLFEKKLISYSTFLKIKNSFDNIKMFLEF